jgi:iron-sulfur cluster repair protein YtfE (RIC family)
MTRNPLTALSIEKSILYEEGAFRAALDLFEIDKEAGRMQLRSFSQGKLIDFLSQQHAIYLNKLIPEIEQQFLRMLELEPTQTNTTLRLFVQFRSFTEELKEHIEFEEKAMFPLIRANWSTKANPSTSVLSQSHHLHDEEVFRILEELVKESDKLGHLMPFRMLLEKLKVLYSELRLHAAIEDEVLLAN